MTSMRDEAGGIASNSEKRRSQLHRRGSCQSQSRGKADDIDNMHSDQGSQFVWGKQRILELFGHSCQLPPPPSSSSTTKPSSPQLVSSFSGTGHVYSHESNAHHANITFMATELSKIIPSSMHHLSNNNSKQMKTIVSQQSKICNSKQRHHHSHFHFSNFNSVSKFHSRLASLSFFPMVIFLAHVGIIITTAASAPEVAAENGNLLGNSNNWRSLDLERQLQPDNATVNVDKGDFTRMQVFNFNPDDPFGSGGSGGTISTNDATQQQQQGERGPDSSKENEGEMQANSFYVLGSDFNSGFSHSKTNNNEEDDNSSSSSNSNVIHLNPDGPFGQQPQNTFDNDISSQTSNSSSSSATATTTTSAASSCQTTCQHTPTYDLIPILPNCNEYVLCQNREETMVFTCPQNMKFSNQLKKCDLAERVECDCTLGASNAVNTEAIDAEDLGTEANQGIGSNNSFNLQVNNGIMGMSPFSYELDTICQGVANDAVPVLSSSCKEYVSCYDGQISNQNTCPDGLLFDYSIKGCNWEASVDCPTLAPTTLKTENPTKAPSPLPTLPAVPQQTPKPSLAPTNSPVPETQKPVPPTPLPTPPPTKQPTPSPVPPVATNAPTLELSAIDWISSHRAQLNQKVFRAYTPLEGVSFRSYWFQYSDFFKALQVMGDAKNPITDNPNLVFYLGDSGMGGSSEWEYGLINVAAFLAQAMTESISHDACDEFHWETNTDDNDDSNGNKDAENYAISNSCGQDEQNYQEFRCMPEESHMECPVDRNMVIQATTSQVFPNAPPPLECRPRTTTDAFTGFWDVEKGKEQVFFPYENSFGRTDVEGCCYWGRGAIHTKGICNIGKLNYYLGAKAAEDGRPSRYPNVDFCSFPEAICAGSNSREMRWVTSMFEWSERIQTYDDGKGWNYLKKLRDFVEGGMIDFEFLDSVSAIVNKGCHSPPCNGASKSVNGGLGAGMSVHLEEERSNNFKVVLEALERPGEKALIRATTKYFTDRQETINSQILLSQTPQGQLYPSYRYSLSDFLSALAVISEEGVGGRRFYLGEPLEAEGVKYGIVNAVMFLAQAYKESIQYDACDENNWELVNDRFPLSNSCGQLDMSYQDMHCAEDEAYMECPVKPEMEQYALTSALWFQAPAPFKCGPRSKFPKTGFWDYELGRENNLDAYANSRGRVDVEGCCWWGRGVMQTRGTCNYGKLNYFLGARAARDGRPARYPKIDFCEFPQGVCSSDETYGGELQWMVGLFEWADRIQQYNKDGWNYIEKLKEFCDGGYTDFSFVDAVSGIVNIGCHDPPCQGYSGSSVEPHNKRERNDTFQRFLNEFQVARNFPPPPPPTPMPSPAPTDEPTQALPTTAAPTSLGEPTETPTSSPRPTSLQGRPPDEAVIALKDPLASAKSGFERFLLKSEHPTGIWPSYVYTWTGFQQALEKMTTGVGPGEKDWFYIGDGESPNSLQYGLVNIAAFVAHGITQAIRYDACDENNYELVDFRYPISNSCGQGGMSYQDDICTDGDEGQGYECPVDTSMEMYGTTHARWVGAPRPLYCGDKTTGYWDHRTGLEVHDPPFANAAGRTDVRGCCWWGRGVMQVRGVCSYGKLNYYLGKGAADDRRPSLYPDIDFCKNPSAICTDPKRGPELRWLTGMFYWAHTVQRNRNFDYINSLQLYVDTNVVSGNYKEDTSFIVAINNILGGTPDDMSNRTTAFLTALEVFGLVEPDITAEPIAVEVFPADVTNPAAKNETGSLGRGPNNSSDTTPGNGADSTNDNGSAAGSSENVLAPENLTERDPAEAGTPVALSSIATTNYCGATWGDASSTCSLACAGGFDSECPPGQKCFGDISCSPNTASTITVVQSGTSYNYCGFDWTDASSRCSGKCPGGVNGECPPGQSCFDMSGTCSGY